MLTCEYSVVIMYSVSNLYKKRKKEGENYETKGILIVILYSNQCQT